MRRLPILFVFFLLLAACGDSDGSALFTDQTVGGEGATGSTAAVGEPSPADSGVSADLMLEELRSRCAEGNFQMCDILFLASDFDSELESFGDSCGGLSTSDEGSCADEFGVAYDLGDLRGDCGDGDMVACDLLYLYSPFDSLDEAFGDECGGLGGGTNRTCVLSWGFVVDPG
jgi:hypothetical protein